MNRNRDDKRYAVAVCIFIVLAMGFAGWYENYVPVPQPSVEQMIRACDRQVGHEFRSLVKR